MLHRTRRVTALNRQPSVHSALQRHRYSVATLRAMKTAQRRFIWRRVSWASRLLGIKGAIWTRKERRLCRKDCRVQSNDAWSETPTGCFRHCMKSALPCPCIIRISSSSGSGRSSQYFETEFHNDEPMTKYRKGSANYSKTAPSVSTLCRRRMTLTHRQTRKKRILRSQNWHTTTV